MEEGFQGLGRLWMELDRRFERASAGFGGEVASFVGVEAAGGFARTLSTLSRATHLERAIGFCLTRKGSSLSEFSSALSALSTYCFQTGFLRMVAEMAAFC